MRSLIQSLWLLITKFFFIIVNKLREEEVFKKIEIHHYLDNFGDCMNSDKSKSKVIQIPYLHETEVVTEIVVEVIFIIGIIEHFIV